MENMIMVTLLSLLCISGCKTSARATSVDETEKSGIQSGLILFSPMA
jgi:hypothetical protein